MIWVISFLQDCQIKFIPKVYRYKEISLRLMNFQKFSFYMFTIIFIYLYNKLKYRKNLVLV